MSNEEIRKFNEIIRSLSSEERKVLRYFIIYRSVGELIAIRELRGLYNIKDPSKIIARLLDLGILERGIGCYNISRKLLTYIKEGKVSIV